MDQHIVYENDKIIGLGYPIVFDEEEIEKEGYLMDICGKKECAENIEEVHPHDIQLLIRSKLISVDVKDRVSWVDREYYGVWDNVKKDIISKKIYLINGKFKIKE